MKTKNIEIVAELSSNHNHELENAKQLIIDAKECGCDSVKLQLYEPSDFSKGRLLQQYEKTRTPFEWVPELVKTAREVEIGIFPTIYSKRDLERCEKMGFFNRYKISSFENEDYMLIYHAIKTGKHVIISTDMLPIWNFRDVVSSNFSGTLLKCTSQYPAKEKNMNVSTLKTLGMLFPKATLGLSDHSISSYAAVVSVGLGIEMIEKHFRGSVFDAPEKDFALNTQEMVEFVYDVRHAEKVYGKENFYSGDMSCFKKKRLEDGLFRTIDE